MGGTQPYRLDEVAAALDAAAPAAVERGAEAFDEARRSLRTLAGRLDRTLGDLDQAWRGAAAVSARLDEPLRRTRELLHMLDEGEYGRQLRITANGLAAGQARVRDLVAQRVSGVTDVPFDQHAQRILHDVADGYRDVGLAVGGQAPPPPVPVSEPGPARALLAAAQDDSAPVRLAAGAEPAQLFRPAVPTLGGQPGDPVLPPGGGSGGGGMGMMPFMPPMGGGMGGMGGGMAGAGGGDQAPATKRTAGQGDQGAWGNGQDDGWTVIGRKERVEAARADFRKDFDEKIKKATRGDRDV